MNEIMKKFCSAWYKYMVEIHLRQVGFGYSAYGTITKNKERTQKLKKQT